MPEEHKSPVRSRKQAPVVHFGESCYHRIMDVVHLESQRGGRRKAQGAFCGAQTGERAQRIGPVNCPKCLEKVKRTRTLHGGVLEGSDASRKAKRKLLRQQLHKHIPSFAFMKGFGNKSWLGSMQVPPLSVTMDDKENVQVIGSRMFCSAGWLQRHYPEVFAGIAAALLAGDVQGSGSLWVKDF